MAIHSKFKNSKNYNNVYWKDAKFLEISLETMIRGNLYVNIADFGLKQ